MRSRLAALLATGLALGAHLAGFAVVDGSAARAGAEAAGEGGEKAISLAAATADIAALITQWETPPDSAKAPAPPKTPVAEVLPSLPAPEVAALPVAPTAVSLPEPEAAPKAEAAPKPVAKSAPPKAETPVAEDRPKAKDDKAKPKAEKPDPSPNPATPAQKAKGKGKAAIAGQGTKGKAASGEAGKLQRLADEWRAAIASRLERAKRYPVQANGAKGRVGLRLVIGADGHLKSVKVTKPSGHAALDAAALAAVKSVGRFPKAPKGLGDAGVNVQLRFEP